MKRAIVTLNIDNYDSSIRSVTYPLMKHYAYKVGAEFHEITERRYPDWPPVYEKLQMRDVIREGGFDRVMFMDADCLVYPDTPDWFTMIPEDTVACYGFDWAANRLRVDDDYFRRDGRMIGWAGWLTIGSRMCADLWTPLEMSYEDALRNLFPTVKEVQMNMDAGHLIDDYCLSRNIARFGLKVTTIQAVMKQFAQEGNWYWHRYDVPHDQKASYMQTVLNGGPVRNDGETETRQLPGWKIPLKMLRGAEVAFVR